MKFPMLQLASGQAAPTYNFGIESLQSHEYSVGIFVFMMISIALFVGIMIVFIKARSSSKMKTGEWVLMGMILLGVIAASVVAALQLLEGYLF